MRHSYAVILELDGRAFDPTMFWFAFDKICIVPSQRLVMSPFAAVQLVQSKSSATELRRHIDDCPRSGITAAYVIGIDADRDVPATHAATAWLTKRFGDVPTDRRKKRSGPPED